MYPRSSFGVRRSFFCTLVPVSGVQGTSAKTTFLETTPLWTPEHRDVLRYNCRKAKTNTPQIMKQVCTRRGSHSAKDVFLPSKRLLSAFYKTLPSKNPSKNLVFFYWKPFQAPSENPSKKHLLLENLLRTLLRVACCCMTPLVCGCAP